MPIETNSSSNSIASFENTEKKKLSDAMEKVKNIEKIKMECAEAASRLKSKLILTAHENPEAVASIMDLKLQRDSSGNLKRTSTGEVIGYNGILFDRIYDPDMKNIINTYSKEFSRNCISKSK